MESLLCLFLSEIMQQYVTVFLESEGREREKLSNPTSHVARAED